MNGDLRRNKYEKEIKINIFLIKCVPNGRGEPPTFQSQGEHLTTAPFWCNMIYVNKPFLPQMNKLHSAMPSFSPILMIAVICSF